MEDVPASSDRVEGMRVHLGRHGLRESGDQGGQNLTGILDGYKIAFCKFSAVPEQLPL